MSGVKSFCNNIIESQKTNLPEKFFNPASNGKNHVLRSNSCSDPINLKTLHCNIASNSAAFKAGQLIDDYTPYSALKKPSCHCSTVGSLLSRYNQNPMICVNMDTGSTGTNHTSVSNAENWNL